MFGRTEQPFIDLGINIVYINSIYDMKYPIIRTYPILTKFSVIFIVKTANYKTLTLQENIHIGQIRQRIACVNSIPPTH